MQKHSFLSEENASGRIICPGTQYRSSGNYEAFLWYQQLLAHTQAKIKTKADLTQNIRHSQLNVPYTSFHHPIT